MLRVSLLGEQTIVDDERGVRTRSPRTVALVAFLVAHAGSPQVRQRIAGLFWPESTDAQALTNLRRELHHLRHVLDDAASLVVTSHDLCWRDTETCRVDVRVFDIERRAALAAAANGDNEGVLAHATRAIAEYKGDLLPGAYDDWLIDARSDLERQCADLCDLVGATRARTGDLAGAVDAARRRIQLRPLEEIGYRTLMGWQAELGDRAGAVSTYHRCASVLERELGVLPDPATRQAFQTLLARAERAEPAGPARPGETGEAAASDASAASAASAETGERAASAAWQAPAGGRSGFAAARLVGRSKELSLLHDRWQATVTGRPGLALVRGGAGVGKTRLVTEIAELARRQGAVVATSQCFGSSGRLALAPVADWLRNPAVQSATAWLEEVWRTEVERLVPSGGRAQRAAGSSAMVDAWQRHRFFEGLARALIAVDRPMLLVLDNVQWCDQETLAFLTFCLALAPGTQIMVAATQRDDDPAEDPELARWIVRMRAAGLLTELSLSPMEAAETTLLAEAVSGRPLDEAAAQLLQATTGGFPLYVIEAVRGGADPGGGDTGVGAETDDTDPGGAESGGAAASLISPSIGDLSSVLRNRLERVTPAAREVAGLAAAVGTDFTLDLLTEASDFDAGAVVESVDELWRRRIIRDFRDGYDFSHDLLREAAYEQVSRPKRWLLHRRVAQSLELLHADDADAVSAQLAKQYARGGQPDRALAYYRRAADVAAGLFAHAEAIRLHKEALSIVRGRTAGSARDSQELAVLEAMAAPLNARFGYSSPELEQALQRSVALAESLGRTDSLVTSLVGLWTSQFVHGRSADGYRTAARALALVDPGSEPSAAAHFAVGGSAVSLGRPAEALRHLELAARLASGAGWLSVGTRPDVHAAAWAAHAHWLLGHDEEALSSCAAAIDLARAIHHPYSLAVALAYGAITLQMRHDLPRLRETVGELRELCERYGFAYYSEWGLILDGWSRTSRPSHPSRPDQSGIGLARQGVSGLKSQGSFARMPYWLSLLADLAARDNRPDEARAVLDAAIAAARARDDLWWLPEVMRMRAGYDEAEQAVSRLRAAARMAAAHGSTALVRRCERDLAAAEARPGRTVPPPLALGRAGQGATGQGERARSTRRTPRANAGRTPTGLASPELDEPATIRGDSIMTITSGASGVSAAPGGIAAVPYEDLATALRGHLILPGDPEYDQARAVYNGMIDRHPAAIARCRDVVDVIACVRFCREHDVAIAVRGGGHNAAGLGVGDAALVIDLSLLRSTTVSPGDHNVRVDAGCTWADVDHATVGFGMATPSGFLSSTGVGGLTLGGGIGYLSRRFGLTVDNLLAADVVLADGTFVTASEDSHSDLFWALRGGGGNFGVVTSFTFRCHDIGEGGTIIGGPILYDFADTADVMRWYRELLPSLPEELNGWIGLITIPPAPPFPEELWGRKSCVIVWCYTGPHDRADEVLEPIKAYGSPLVVGLHDMPFTALQSAFDGLYPAGLQWYWRADFFNEISDAAIDVHRKYGERLPTGHSTMHLYPIDGAAGRVPADATAFAYREGGWAGVIVGVDPDPANAGLISSWARDYWEDLHPTSAGGAYVNFLMDEGQDRVKASYGGNYDRLTQVKDRYDPDNVFHINQNIRPARTSTA
jgi:DNA-binding SARP family transcriptional activator/tetratricopeptide (TPR) repeat protein